MLLFIEDIVLDPAVLESDKAETSEFVWVIEFLLVSLSSFILQSTKAPN